MKTALVLSGGGGKGAYQIGVWKALRRLHIKFDIVTGTSVGALNGALIVQNNYVKAVKLWENVDFSIVFNEKDIADIKKDRNDFSIVKMYLKNIFKGGMDVSNFEKMVKDVLEEDKVANSKQDFGLVTYNLSNMKPLVITNKNLDPTLLADYLIASASCFPFFTTKKINNKNFIDGGYYDNLPINPAIDLGADKIIAIDLGTIGLINKPKKNLDITYIRPNNEIGSFLVFDSTLARRALKLGYNDTMKVYQKYYGLEYSFYGFSYKRNKKKYYKEFNTILNSLNKKHKNLINDLLTDVKNLAIDKKNDPFISGLEFLLKTYGYDESLVYNPLKLNRYLKKAFAKTKGLTEQSFTKYLVDKKKIPKSKALIKYIYNALVLGNDVTKISTLFTNEYLAAIYMYTITK